MPDPKHAEFDDLLREGRTFPPPKAFRDQAVASDEGVYAEAARDPEAFWARLAGELEWSRPWTTVLDWQPPHAKWFVGGQLNVSVNCLDRHVRGARRNKAAIIWEGEPGRSTDADVLRPPPRGLDVCQRPEIARHEEGRPRRAVHAAGARAGDRDARVRPHRRRAQRGVRRLQRRVAARPHQRRAGAAARHGRRRLPPRQHRRPQGDRRRGRRRDRRRSNTSSCSGAAATSRSRSR